MRWLTLALLVLIASLQYPLWIGKGSWLRVWDLSRQIDNQVEVNNGLKARNDGMDAEVRGVKKMGRRPDLIIIDEPTEGLAPKIVELVAQYLKVLKQRGISVLLIEQKLTIAMDISDRCMVMGHGSIVFTGTPAELRNDSYIRKEWLEV